LSILTLEQPVEAATLLHPRLLRCIHKAHRAFEPTRRQLLWARSQRAHRLKSGELPAVPAPSPANTSSWKVRPVPQDYLCRRVEITGPIHNRKMVIQMLSRNEQGDRADTAMLDFEDSMKPLWSNVLAGLSNLAAAAVGDLWFQEERSAGGSKTYRLDPTDMPALMVRLRGLHLLERHCPMADCPTEKPVSAGLFDLIACAYHSAEALLARGRTPHYYIPKCEDWAEARWWDRLFSFVENEMGLPHGTLRCTVLIETLPATLQMEEILYELRGRALGLNLGRWDKIFSDVKTLFHHRDRVMADRATINFQRPWMEAYARRLVHVCHAHGAFAIGGMAACTPGRDEAKRAAQAAVVRQDKAFEAKLGCDGAWVSHPWFIAHAAAAFPIPNQLDAPLPPSPAWTELLPQGCGPITLRGLRENLSVGIAYALGWVQGKGCIAWNDCMEDLATFEICRMQVCQWLHAGTRLESGQLVEPGLVARLIDEEKEGVAEQTGSEMMPLDHAAALVRQWFLRTDPQPFFSDDKEVDDVSF
jgi:malate synthase